MEEMEGREETSILKLQKNIILLNTFIKIFFLKQKTGTPAKKIKDTVKTEKI